MTCEQRLGGHSLAAWQLNFRERDGALAARHDHAMRTESEYLPWLAQTVHDPWHEDLGQLPVKANGCAWPRIDPAGASRHRARRLGEI